MIAKGLQPAPAPYGTTDVSGGTGRSRTCALPLKRRLLWPLSYDPDVVGPAGFAPASSRISGERLHSLSYEPLFLVAAAGLAPALIRF